MVKINSILNNPDGLHARAAAVFVQHTNRFKCDIFLTVGSDTVDAKSIMGILALGVSSGDLMSVTFDGFDELAASKEIQDLIESDTLPISQS